MTRTAPAAAAEVVADQTQPTAAEVDQRCDEIRSVLMTKESVLARDLFGEQPASVTRAAIWQLTSSGDAVLRPAIVDDGEGHTDGTFKLIRCSVSGSNISARHT